MKLYKQRIDAAKIYDSQNRDDLSKVEIFQAEVIKGYLPKQLDEYEIEVEVKRIIENSGASSLADIGKVIGITISKLKGKADGGTISKIVKKLLSS